MHSEYSTTSNICCPLDPGFTQREHRTERIKLPTQIQQSRESSQWRHDSFDTLCQCCSTFWKPVLCGATHNNGRHIMTHAGERHINWRYKRSRQQDGTHLSDLSRSRQSRCEMAWCCYRCSQWKRKSLPTLMENWNYRVREKKSMITFRPAAATVISDKTFFFKLN